MLLLAGDKAGHILASLLERAGAELFHGDAGTVVGIDLARRTRLFQLATGRRERAGRVWPAESPVAVKMKNLCGTGKRSGLMFRLALLQLVIEIFAEGLEPVASEPAHADVKERLHAFLLEMPPAALLEISFESLAQLIHCTPRHLNRVFFDVAGMSFRDKRAEIRLACARELLATSQFKVVDVAFKSGYKSLSLFNRMFTRRFGRQSRPVASKKRQPQSNQPQNAFASRQPLAFVISAIPAGGARQNSSVALKRILVLRCFRWNRMLVGSHDETGLNAFISRIPRGRYPPLARAKSGKMPDFTGWKPVPPVRTHAPRAASTRLPPAAPAPVPRRQYASAPPGPPLRFRRPTAPRHTFPDDA